MQGYEDPMRQGSGDFVGFGGFERAMLNSAGVAIVATLPDGIITHFNPEAERMLGYRARELIGRYTPEIFHDRAEIELRARELSSEPGHEVKPGFDVFVQNTRAEKAESREWTYVRKDG
ncbi:MAG TPA: PAS domain-containing protein, partial [Turneriella sp.]|nr:PAS domain-containing protein [Turneriella sp.]